MDKLVITGGVPLRGEVKISKAKNAYLPILAAVLLNEHEIILRNVPELRDIQTMFSLMKNLGVNIQHLGGRDFSFDASNITSLEAAYDFVKTMRASVCILGPLLARFGKARASFPGGCAIGARPIDFHLKNFQKMGATVSIDKGIIEVHAKELRSTTLRLNFPSVGATENLVMAAVFTEGETIIENAALEPEIDDLIRFLIKMGAVIYGMGTKTLKICGVSSLKGCEYEAIGDRIEAGTYIMASLATEGEVRVSGFNPEHLEFVLEVLKDMGAEINRGRYFVDVFPSKLRSLRVETSPYPGLPTDLQAQLTALCLKASGTSEIIETIFENRFMHVPELQRLKADITLEGNKAVICETRDLKGAPVMCSDLRASAALVIAALMSSGTTEISRIYHLERGHEKLFEKLKRLGASIEKVKAD